jgi:hypothetical protein
MTFLGSTVPYYGGKQVQNPANVLQTPGSGAPSANLKVSIGTIAINASGTAYIATLLTGGSTTWSLFVMTGGDVISVTGTANQIHASPTTGAVILSLIGPYTPATYTSHGVLLGAGTSSIVATAEGATGTVLIGTTGANASFSSAPAVTSLSASANISGASITATGDGGGIASATQLSNVASSTISTGIGSVKMSTGNAATNTEWIKIYIGTSAYWIPAWTTNAP